MTNWIELKEEVGELGNMAVFVATCHHDGYETEGFALCGEEDTVFYDTDPREMEEEDLAGGWTLPGYMFGERPEEYEDFEILFKEKGIIVYVENERVFIADGNSSDERPDTPENRKAAIEEAKEIVAEWKKGCRFHDVGDIMTFVAQENAILAGERYEKGEEVSIRLTSFWYEKDGMGEGGPWGRAGYTSQKLLEIGKVEK